MTKSPVKLMPTMLLNHGSTGSLRQAIQLTPVNSPVTPKYTRNTTQFLLAPGQSGSNMSFKLSRNSAMNATCDAVNVHQPKTLIQAHMYDAKRPVGVSHRRWM